MVTCHNDLHSKKWKKDTNIFNIYNAVSQEDAIEVVRRSIKSIIVLEPSFGGKFMYTYFNKIKHLDNIDKVILYCSDVKKHKGWTSDYKVKGKDIIIENDFKVLKGTIVKAAKDVYF